MGREPQQSFGPPSRRASISGDPFNHTRRGAGGGRPCLDGGIPPKRAERGPAPTPQAAARSHRAPWGTPAWLAHQLRPRKRQQATPRDRPRRPRPARKIDTAASHIHTFIAPLPLPVTAPRQPPHWMTIYSQIRGTGSSGTGEERQDGEKVQPAREQRKQPSATCPEIRCQRRKPGRTPWLGICLTRKSAAPGGYGPLRPPQAIDVTTSCFSSSPYPETRPTGDSTAGGFQLGRGRRGFDQLRTGGGGGVERR